jgi:hypothetical protein
MQHTTGELLEAAIAMLHDAPKVDIKGKKYSTVATRVQCFRQYFADWSIINTPFGIEDAWVRVKCEISDPDGRVIASDMAEENRSQGPINKTSALENCTTSAIGRALAAFGLHGGEYASAGEVSNAIAAQTEETAKDGEKKMGWTKSELKAASHDISSQIHAAENMDELQQFWESAEIKLARTRMKTHYPEGLDAVMEAKEHMKDRLTDDEERRAIQGEPQSNLDAG